MDHQHSEQKSTTEHPGKPEEVRGILQRLLRLITQDMAKKLFARSQKGSVQQHRQSRRPQ